MEEPTSDMLPDVQPESVPAPQETVSEDVNPVSDAGPQEDAPAETDSKVPSGHVPYSRFKQEIQKRQELEKQLENFQASSAPEEVEVETEENPLAQKVRELEMNSYLRDYPELADQRADLDAYLEENSNLSLEQGVKLFRAELGIAAPARKGLEKVVAGPKTAPAPRYSKEEVDSMRVNDPDKWMKLTNAGAFDDVTGW